MKLLTPLYTARHNPRGRYVTLVTNTLLHHLEQQQNMSGVIARTSMGFLLAVYRLCALAVC